MVRIGLKPNSFCQRLLGNVNDLTAAPTSLARSTVGLQFLVRRFVLNCRGTEEKLNIAGSSNGRTTVSGAVYRGSSPCPAANSC